MATQTIREYHYILQMKNAYEKYLRKAHGGRNKTCLLIENTNSKICFSLHLKSLQIMCEYKNNR